VSTTMSQPLSKYYVIWAINSFVKWRASKQYAKLIGRKLFISLQKFKLLGCSFILVS